MHPDAASKPRPLAVRFLIALLGCALAVALVTGCTVGVGGDEAAGTTDAPLLLAPAVTTPAVLAMTSNSSTTCAALSDGTLYCWGVMAGDGTSVPYTSPVLITTTSPPIQLAAGWAHVCALLANGTVVCWGDNSHGQLGDGTHAMRFRPTLVSGLTNVKQLSAGFWFSCALINGGTVKCWGDDSFKQLGFGDGSTTDQVTPRAVPGLSAVGQIAGSVTASATLAVMNDHTVRMSGASGFTAVAGLTNVVRATIAFANACALAQDGTLKCWRGMAADGTGGQATSPTLVPLGGRTASDVAAGTSVTYVTFTDGTAMAWGTDSQQLGVFGDGTTASQRLSPVAVVDVGGASPLTKVRVTPPGSVAGSIVAGDTDACVLLASGAMRCWGGGSPGLLGNGNNNGSPVPVAPFHDCGDGDSCHATFAFNAISGRCVAVSAPANPVACRGSLTAFTMGTNSTCAAFGDQGLRCWGSLPLPPTGSSREFLSPTLVATQTNFTEMTDGWTHTCALQSGGASGTVVCGGDNSHGQIGDGTIGSGTTINRAFPTGVAGLTGVAHLAAGGYTTCAIMSGTGELKCWGKLPTVAAATAPTTLFASGIVQAAIDPSSNRMLVVDSTGHVQQAIGGAFTTMTNLAGVVEVATTDEAACARTSSGTVSCWGIGGLVGDGTMTTRTAPVPIALSGVVKLTAGYCDFYAVLSNGTVMAWGKPDNSALGNGMGTLATAPVPVSNISTALSVRGGYFNGCALLPNQEVRCWGFNDFGELGDGTVTTRSLPVQVSL